MHRDQNSVTSDLDEMLKSCATVYDGLSDVYDAARFENDFGRYDREESEAALQFLMDRFYPEQRERLSALDVATGTGKVAICLARMGVDVIGLDASPGMLDHCAENAKRQGVSLKLKLGSAGELPFPSDSFDLVLSFRFFHLFPPSSYTHLICEMARVTKPGGCLLLEFKNARYGLLIQTARSLMRSEQDAGTTYAVTCKDLARFARECDLELTLVTGTVLPKGSLALHQEKVKMILRQLARGALKGTSMSLVAAFRKGHSWQSRQKTVF